MPLQIVRNDITRIKADAIVNTANPKPVYSNGTDRAIYEAAGADRLLAERKKIGAIERGDIAVTSAYALDAKYIIHTVGPVWVDGNSGEYDILASCYRKSLEKATELGCESIAFPLIATGVYGFPKDKALQIAMQVIGAYLMSHEMNAILVVFDRDSFELSGKVLSDVAELIDDAAVHEKRDFEYLGRDPEYFQRNRMRRREVPETAVIPKTEPEEPDLEDLLGKKTESFRECLFRMIDERGLKDSEVYTKANIDRKHFSKIRCNDDYHPKKKTAVALAMALELDLEDTKLLLSRAEWALTEANTFDRIVTYFIKTKEYDIISTVNPVLFKYDQPTLGV